MADAEAAAFRAKFAAERAWREALRLTTARADREFLCRRLAACWPEGGEAEQRCGGDSVHVK